MFRRHHCRNCGQSFCDEHTKDRRRLPWFCMGHSVRVCRPCQQVIDSGEFEKGIVQRHLQRVADVQSLVESARPASVATPVHAHPYAATAAPAAAVVVDDKQF